MDQTQETPIREPIGRIMARIGRIFFANLQNNLSHLDIERSFYPLLLIEEGKGNMTQQDLAEKLAIDKVQVVRIVDYLSSNGYVEREQDIRDRRKHNLVITKKAEMSIPNIKLAIQKTTKLVLKSISEDQVEELYFLLKTIDKNIQSQKVN